MPHDIRGPENEDRLIRAHALVIELLDTLLMAEGDALDAAVDGALAEIGSFADVDRAYVFLARADGSFDNTHEWVAPGIVPMIGELQGLDPALLGPWIAPLLRGEEVQADVARLPDDAPLKDHLSRQAIRSVVLVPMIEADHLTGLVGFDAVRGLRHFPPEEVRLLRSLARVLGVRVTRRNAERAAEQARIGERQTRSRLEATLRALPGLVIELDATGRYIDVHTNDPGLLVRSPSDIVGRLPEEVDPPHLAAQVRDCMAEVQATGQPSHRVYPLDVAGGRRWFESTMVRHGADDPTMRGGYVLTVRDITRERDRDSQIRLLSYLAQQTTNLVAITNADRRIDWVNPAFERRTGYSLAEAQGRTIAELVHCDGTDQSIVAAVHAALDRGEGTQGAELQYQSKSGERYWVEIDVQPLVGEEGDRVAFFTSQTDITARKRQEAELADLARRAEEARDRLHAAVNALPDAFALYDRDDRLVVFNERYRQFYARSAEAIRPGATYEEVLRAGLANGEYPDAAGREDRWLADRLAAHSQTRNVRETHLGDGRWVRVIEQETPEGGRVGLRVDITEAKEAQRRLDDIIAAAEAGTWEWDVPSGLERHNDRWGAMLGYGPGELDALSYERWSAIVHPEDIARVERENARVFAGETAQFECEYRMRHRQGHWIWVLSRGRVTQRGPDGQPLVMAGVHLDITDRKETEAQLDTIIGAAQVGTWELDITASVNRINAIWAQMIGYELDEITPMDTARWTSLVHPEDFEDVMASVGAVLSGATLHYEQEFRLRHKDGHWVWVLSRGRVVRRGDDGRPLVLAGVHLDISRIKQAEQRLDDIIHGARAGTWEWDIVAGRNQHNERWAEIIGYTLEELGDVGVVDWPSLLHPEDRDRIDAELERVFRRETDRFEYEFRMRHKDGRWIWILSRGRVTRRSKGGQPLITAGVHIDITERKKLEAQLQAERDYLGQLMETSVSAIIALDDQGRIIFANGEAEKVLGLTPAEMTGRRFDDPAWQITTLDGAHVPAAELPFARVMATGEPVRDLRHMIEWADGRRQALSVNAALIEAPDSVARVVCSVTDITTHIQAEAALRAAAERAQAASEAKSRFLANMSHEIRTPLNGVLGMAEVLEQSLSDPSHREMIGIIRDSGEVLLTVLNDVLDMSKIEAGKLSLETEPFHPGDLARRVDALYAVKARSKNLDFTVLTDCGGDDARLGDQNRILQVLHNLIGNALKFTERGEVTVSFRCRPGIPLRITVRDEGIGMTPEQMARVFEDFEQADGTVTRRFGGTGLGLSIVRKLVDLMGGHIRLDSVPGQGTTVEVVLPLPLAAPRAGEPATLEPAQPAPAQAPALAGLRALVADDNATNRLILKAMLAGFGMEATIVSDGQEALDAWRPGDFDVVLLDISMPGMDGLTALGHLRAAMTAQTSVPVLAITANAMTHQVQEYLAAGFDGHVGKPVRLDRLAEEIARVAGPATVPAAD